MAKIKVNDSLKWLASGADLELRPVLGGGYLVEFDGCPAVVTCNTYGMHIDTEAWRYDLQPGGFLDLGLSVDSLTDTWRQRISQTLENAASHPLNGLVSVHTDELLDAVKFGLKRGSVSLWTHPAQAGVGVWFQDRDAGIEVETMIRAQPVGSARQWSMAVNPEYLKAALTGIGDRVMIAPAGDGFWMIGATRLAYVMCIKATGNQPVKDQSRVTGWQYTPPFVPWRGKLSLPRKHRPEKREPVDIPVMVEIVMRRGKKEVFIQLMP